MAKTVLVRVAKRDIGYTKNPETGVMQDAFLRLFCKKMQLCFNASMYKLSFILQMARPNFKLL